MIKAFVLPGIGPDHQHTAENSDNPQEDPKSVREFLANAYDKNISTRLKIELGSSDISSYNNKEMSISNYLQSFPSYSKSLLYTISKKLRCFNVP